MNRELSDRELASLTGRWPGEWVTSPRMAYRRGLHGHTHHVILSPAGFACTRLEKGKKHTVQHKDPKRGLLEAENYLASKYAVVRRALE